MFKLRCLCKFVCLLLLLSSTNIYALERCQALVPDIRSAHFKYFGVQFPYWFSVAQAEKESNCRHYIKSTDGIGSEGFAQITWRWWSTQLIKQGIYEIKSITEHAKAQSYINYTYYKQSYCKKLFEMYQMYNGGALVCKELQRAKSCNWSDGKNVCKRKDVCVLVSNTGCKQWRNACDINYSYSLTIWSLSPKYAPTKVQNKCGTYNYW